MYEETQNQIKAFLQREKKHWTAFVVILIACLVINFQLIGICEPCPLRVWNEVAFPSYFYLHYGNLYGFSVWWIIISIAWWVKAEQLLTKSKGNAYILAVNVKRGLSLVFLYVFLVLGLYFRLCDTSWDQDVVHLMLYPKGAGELYWGGALVLAVFLRKRLMLMALKGSFYKSEEIQRSSREDILDDLEF